MRLNGKRVLVTGADGFIGSHLTEALVRLGCDVRAFVYYNSFNSWGWLDQCAPDVRGGFEAFPGDIRDPNRVREAVRDRDVVLHLAALIAIPYSYHAPASYVETNVSGTLNVLQAARDLGVERLVHTSTSEVYGTARFTPITEEHPLQGQSPYAATKIGADHLALSYQLSFDTPVAVIRPFNTYGPRQSARAVIPTIIAQILDGRREVRLGALHPVRDFNYVADTVNGFLRVAESDAAIGEIVNIGSGEGVTIGRVAELVAEVMGVEISIACDQERVRPAKSEVGELIAANAKARELCGWTPEYAGQDGLRRGLAETAAWFSEPGRLNAYKAGIYNI